MKLKRIAAIALATMTMAVGVMSISASAANTTDENFSISITSTSTKRSNSASRRLKTNSTSTFVNYKTLKDGSTSASGPYKFVAYVYGSDTSSSALVDLSSYDSSGNARKKAVVTKGTKGFIKQLVNETFGSNAYAQLYGSQYSGSTTGTAKGCWSPDSVADSSAVNYN